MKNVFINVTNHEVTPEQVADAKNRFGCSEFFKVPFPNVPASGTEADVREISLKLLEEIAKVIKGNKDHDEVYIMIQGEFGVTYATVRYLLLEKKWHPVYAATERESVEEHMPDGTVRKMVVFKHAGFREYRRLI